MKILHIITSLGDGGAEHTLYKICKYDKQNRHIVISLKSSDKYVPLCNKLGIRVYCLNMKNFLHIYKFFYLIKLISNLKPDLVQTWLVHGDFIGGIAAKFAGIKKIIWNIRYSNLESGKAKFSTIILVKILVILSFYIPESIVVVSKRAKLDSEKLGYSKKKLFLISNGYDFKILKPNKKDKLFLKKKINLKKRIPIIGKVARYDAKKDHLNLLKALAFISKKKIKFFCVLIGTGIDRNKVLLNEIKKLKLIKNVKLLAPINDITKVMNGLDIHVQSSRYGEGFPNVVAEAMACGTPCVTTDVGEASFIVGNSGWIVPPKNSIRLAKALEKSLIEIGTKKWNKRRNKARKRIKENFDIFKMIASYNNLWSNVNNKN
jgi:glycosyltransferase involved in cell wall biosynthesis